MRCTEAHPYRSWQQRMRQAETRRSEAEQARLQAEQNLAEQARILDASDLHVGAASEREEAILARPTARLHDEYGRTCFALGVAPRALDVVGPTRIGRRRSCGSSIIRPDR